MRLTIVTIQYRAFAHDVTVAILVSQNNETAATLVSQSSPVGVELSFLMQTLSFVPINLHRCWQSEWKRSILLKSDLKTRRSRFFKTDFKVFGFRKNTFSKTHKMNHYLSTFFARHARNSLRPHHTLENIIHDSNTTCSIMFSSSFHQCFGKQKKWQPVSCACVLYACLLPSHKERNTHLQLKKSILLRNICWSTWNSIA